MKCERCHQGYRVLSRVRPTVYCDCPVGVLAKAMDDDPLDNVKAERWERAKRADTSASRSDSGRSNDG